MNRNTIALSLAGSLAVALASAAMAGRCLPRSWSARRSATAFR